MATEEEWIELKNSNNEIIDISDWKIQDTIGSTKTYIFPENTKIAGQGFLLLKRPDSRITLNNSGDGVKLLHPNDEVVDEVTFEKAGLAQSYNRKGSEWTWSTALTPKTENIIRGFKSEEKPISSLENTIEKELSENQTQVTRFIFSYFFCCFDPNH